MAKLQPAAVFFPFEVQHVTFTGPYQEIAKLEVLSLGVHIEKKNVHNGVELTTCLILSCANLTA